MARTRLHVLPQDHPAAVMTHAAGGTLATTWLTKVFELMGTVALPGTPLEIDVLAWPGRVLTRAPESSF